MATSESNIASSVGNERPERGGISTGLVRHLAELKAVDSQLNLSPDINTAPQQQGLIMDSTEAAMPELTIDPKEYAVPKPFVKKLFDFRPQFTFRRENIADLGNIYRKQRRHHFQEDRKPRLVPIRISEAVGKMYVKTITQHAIPKINEAVPGICLQVVENEDTPIQIHIRNTNEDVEKPKDFEKEAYTKGNIHPTGTGLANIYFGDKYIKQLPVYMHLKGYQRICFHELLHALGLKHTHEIQHAGSQIKEVISGGQVEPRADILGIVRFDPFSIMLYPYETAKVINKYDPAWRMLLQENTIRINSCMSELDKVALNYIFPPCKHGGYDPQWSSETNMYYCKRYVMESHNTPIPCFTSCCGFDNKGPNCPACRTLKPPEGVEVPENRDIWQGWSGMIYCWKSMPKQPRSNHDGFCGPDYGYACPECKRKLRMT